MCPQGNEECKNENCTCDPCTCKPDALCGCDDRVPDKWRTVDDE